MGGGHEKGEVGSEQREAVNAGEIRERNITQGPHVPEVIRDARPTLPRISLFSTLGARIC